MAKHKRKTNAGSRPRRNPARKNRTRRHHASGGRRHNPARRMNVRHYRRRRNPGDMGGIGPLVTNAVFVIVGALGSKLGAQMVLGTNNVGVVGYAGNAAAGAVLWFLADKVLKNKEAAKGVLSGTAVQIVLRLINDYTPFGQYVSNLGMGDYQMQSFVTPQVLVSPMRNADILVPPGWGPGATPPPAVTMKAAAGVSPAASAPAKGTSGLFSNGGRALF